jgi:hypothetical protein
MPTLVTRTASSLRLVQVQAMEAFFAAGAPAAGGGTPSWMDALEVSAGCSCGAVGRAVAWKESTPLGISRKAPRFSNKQGADDEPAVFGALNCAASRTTTPAGAASPALLQRHLAPFWQHHSFERPAAATSHTHMPHAGGTGHALPSLQLRCAAACCGMPCWGAVLRCVRVAGRGPAGGCLDPLSLGVELYRLALLR